MAVCGAVALKADRSSAACAASASPSAQGVQWRDGRLGRVRPHRRAGRCRTAQRAAQLEAPSSGPTARACAVQGLLAVQRPGAPRCLRERRPRAQRHVAVDAGAAPTEAQRPRRGIRARRLPQGAPVHRRRFAGRQRLDLQLGHVHAAGRAGAAAGRACAAASPARAGRAGLHVDAARCRCRPANPPAPKPGARSSAGRRPPAASMVTEAEPGPSAPPRGRRQSGRTAAPCAFCTCRPGSRVSAAKRVPSLRSSHRHRRPARPPRWPATAAPAAPAAGVVRSAARVRGTRRSPRRFDGAAARRGSICRLVQASEGCRPEACSRIEAFPIQAAVQPRADSGLGRMPAPSQRRPERAERGASAPGIDSAPHSEGLALQGPRDLRRCRWPAPVPIPPRRRSVGGCSRYARTESSPPARNSCESGGHVVRGNTWPSST